jgi:hypothetical protein
MHIIQRAGQWVELKYQGRLIMRRRPETAIDLKTFCWTNNLKFIEVID